MEKVFKNKRLAVDYLLRMGFESVHYDPERFRNNDTGQMVSVWEEAGRYHVPDLDEMYADSANDNYLFENEDY